MVNTVVKTIRLAVKTLVDVSIGTVEFIASAIQQAPVLGIILLIAVVWIAVRYAVIAAVPTLVYMSTALDIFINLIIVAVDAIIIAIKGTCPLQNCVGNSVSR